MAEIIVALDVAAEDEARRLIDRLPGLRWVKIGPMLFLRAGPGFVRELKRKGLRVFLDLKWHDIPNSVAEAVRAASDLGVDLATVHSLGGRAMLAEAVRAAGPLRLAAVSVLTSHGEDYWETLGRRPGGTLLEEVTRLARLAVEAGVHAVVASPREVAAVRQVVGPERWVVTPGIRPAGAATDDHQRAADAPTAVAAGATHLVVGRPILRSEAPDQVYQSLCEAVS